LRLDASGYDVEQKQKRLFQVKRASVILTVDDDEADAHAKKVNVAAKTEPENNDFSPSLSMISC
jgi:hypothetical protein